LLLMVFAKVFNTPMQNQRRSEPSIDELQRRDPCGHLETLERTVPRSLHLVCACVKFSENLKLLNLRLGRRCLALLLLVLELWHLIVVVIIFLLTFLVTSISSTAQFREVDATKVTTTAHH